MTLAQYREHLLKLQAGIKYESEDDEGAAEYHGEIQSVIDAIDNGQDVRAAANWVGISYLVKSPLVLEQTGLIIELLRGDETLVIYSACTHGGWAKYMRDDRHNHIDNFENKSEVILDANKIAKFYNLPLEVRI